MVSLCGDVEGKVSPRSLRIERKTRAAACFVEPIGTIEYKNGNKKERVTVICIAALSFR